MRQKCVCCVARSAPPSQLWDQCCLLSTIRMTVAGVAEFTAIALLCNVLCREGVQCKVVYLGGFFMRGQIWG